MVRRPVYVHANDKQSGEQIPPLEPGDRLTRDEFERRYEAMPRGIKAELLEGGRPYAIADPFSPPWAATFAPDYLLRAGHYERLVPDEGVLHSEVFPGLWLDTAALLRGNLAAVLATLQHGLASPEHAAFVARLRPPSA